MQHTVNRNVSYECQLSVGIVMVECSSGCLLLPFWKVKKKFFKQTHWVFGKWGQLKLWWNKLTLSLKISKVSKSQEESLMKKTSLKMSNRFINSRVRKGQAMWAKREGGDRSKLEGRRPINAGSPSSTPCCWAGTWASVSRSFNFLGEAGNLDFYIKPANF